METLKEERSHDNMSSNNWKRSNNETKGSAINQNIAAATEKSI